LIPGISGLFLVWLVDTLGIGPGAGHKLVVIILTLWWSRLQIDVGEFWVLCDHVGGCIAGE
jgi:hypothetical protein